MSTSRQALARVLAILALLAAVVALTAVIGGSLGPNDGGSQPDRTSEAQPDRNGDRRSGSRNSERDFYIVQSGDTLTAIASETGVSVAELQELNPDVDPQLLSTGERLKLR
jgi:hypothetical protein